MTYRFSSDLKKKVYVLYVYVLFCYCNRLILEQLFHSLYFNVPENDRGRTSKPFHRASCSRCTDEDVFLLSVPASWACRAGWWAQVRQIGLTFSTHPRQTDLIFEFQKWLREGSPIACKIKHIVLRNCFVNLDSPVNNTYGPPPLMLGHRL